MTTRLVKHQKLTKRQIKEDPLVTAAFRGAQAWEQHGSRILMAVGAIALVAVLAILFGQSRSRAEDRAAGNLFRARMSLMQQDYPTAMQLLKQIVDESPGTTAARDAMMLLGDGYVSQGNPAEAVTWYRKYIDKAGKNKEVRAAGLHGLAAALEDRGDFVQAAANYGELAKVGVSDTDRGRALLAQARCLAKAGQTAKAVEVYKEVQKLPVVGMDAYNAAGVALGELSVESPAAR